MAVDYMQIQPDNIDEINPMYVLQTQAGDPLTVEESLFLYYITLGMSQVEAFIRAGFVLPRKVNNSGATSSKDAVIDNIILHGDDEISGEAAKEKEELLDSLNIDKYIPNRQTVTFADIQKLPPSLLLTLRVSANHLAQQPKVQREFLLRQEQISKQQCATKTEIYQYLTAVMRGQIKDQFGLEASLQERTRAAEALAKRLIDIPERISAVYENAKNAQVTLNFQPRIEIEEAEYTEL